MNVVLRHCDCCEKPIPDEAEAFIHEDGGDICADCTVALLRQERDIAQRQLAGAVEALDEIDGLISEVLDTWTWPIRDYADMRPWMLRMIVAVNRGRGQ